MRAMSRTPDLISVPQAAAILGVHRAHALRLVASGALVPVVRVPAGALLDRAQVLALAAERRRNPPRAGRPRKRREPEAIAA